ncbi:MAG: polymer-forming cytoskeletal protein [Magnetococcales bacterium]|nr:polymer-forming cytoskeletal protein [Magnetococcales bacterium]
MAIFNKASEPKIDKSNTTVIAAGTKITGEISIECKLHVDGEFSGQIRSNSLITIGKTGKVDGEIHSKKLIVTGRFEGTADCGEIEILSGGNVSGNISSRVLVIERGSLFQGESQLKETGKETADTAQKAATKADKQKDDKNDKNKSDTGRLTPPPLPNVGTVGAASTPGISKSTKS